MKKVDINYIKTEFEKIQNYFTRRDYAKVIEKTKILLKKDPRQVPFYTYLGLSYKLLGKYDSAIEVLRKGLNFYYMSIWKSFKPPKASLNTKCVNQSI